MTIMYKAWCNLQGFAPSNIKILNKYIKQIGGK